MSLHKKFGFGSCASHFLLVILCLCVPLNAYSKEEDFDTTGYEKQEATEPENTKTPVLSGRPELLEFYNDRQRSLAPLESIWLQLCEKRQHPSECDSQNQLIVSGYKNTMAQGVQKNDLGQIEASYQQAKTFILSKIMGSYPANTISQGRALWMDRGSIIRSQNEAGLRQNIQNIAKAGFNIIYFETLNAGYPIYPSQLLPQNPQIKNWDPLAVAIDEAHKQNIELHSWVWCFAAGNMRHNKIIGLPDSNEGPLLQKLAPQNGALQNVNGSHHPAGQPEYWISPASFETRDFLTSVYQEIVKNYNVDGLQLDYIRYPFQKNGDWMGFESLSRFESETGINTKEDFIYNEEKLKTWLAWKAFQVSSFVRETSLSLKKIKPNLILSAAVFPLPRERRMELIQQDWETWIKNGWIDVLVPMAYSKTPGTIAKLSDYIEESSQNRVLNYPGLSLGRLNAEDLVEAIVNLKDSGVIGSSLFANSQLSTGKQLALASSAFNDTARIIIPHQKPMAAGYHTLMMTQTIVDGLITSGNWFGPEADIKTVKAQLDDLVRLLDPLIQDKKLSTQDIRLKVQARLATISSIITAWKYQSTDHITDVQIQYLMPWINQSTTLLLYALNHEHF